MRRHPRSFRPRVELLEDRLAPAGFVVTDPLDAAQLNAGTNDPTDSNGIISLRSAIAAANVDAGNGTSDSITYAAVLNGKTIALSLGVLELTAGSGTVTIDGGSQVAVSGGGTSGVFQVDSGAQAALQNLTIENGTTASNGGGIDNLGTLTMQSCTISDCSALQGGGILNQGTLMVTGSTFSGNSAISDQFFNGGDGGAIQNALSISASLTISGCTFSGNSATNHGGGISNQGTLTVTGSTFSGSSATASGSFGGAIDNRSEIAGVTAGLTVSGCTFSGNSASLGGGISNENATAMVTASTFSGSSATSSGADIENGSLGSFTLSGSSLSGGTGTSQFATGGSIDNQGTLTVSYTTIAGSSAAIGGGISNQGTLTVSNATITGSSAATGGGIDNEGGTLTVSGSTISGNTATLGGGIDIFNGSTVTLSSSTISGNIGGGIDSGGTVTVNNCTLSGNSTNGFAGGIRNSGTLTLSSSTLSGNFAAIGGGIDNDGTLTVNNCTLSGNSASNSGGGINNAGTVTVNNCTLSGNSATSGGGLENSSFSTVTLSSSTLWANSASSLGGGIANQGTLTLLSTIVAGNTAPTGPDVDGSVTAGSSDLVGNGTAMTGLTNNNSGNQVGTSAGSIDPRLSPLGYYGGPTQTLGLLSGSPALNAGGPLTALGTAPLVTDTTITVANAAAIASTPGAYVIQIDSEQMLVTGVDLTANTLTV